MPPKKPAAEVEMPRAPAVDPQKGLAESLATYFGELKDASARGEGRALQEPHDSRKWMVANVGEREVATGGAATGQAALADAGPEQYADWVRRFGFSVEREIQHTEQEALRTKLTTTKNARHLAHLKAAARHQADDDVAVVKAKAAATGPIPERAAPFPYAVAKEQVDTIMNMQLSADAGDAWTLTRSTDYDDVDFHALVNIGACHASTVGARPDDEGGAWTIEQVVAALVRPYVTTSWRLSAFEAAHMKVRAIARWIAAFVRVVPPPIGPTASASSPATSKPAKADGHVSLALPGAGQPKPSWTPYRVEDNDEDGDDLPSVAGSHGTTPQPGQQPKSNPSVQRGHDTALAVFQTRVGDPHQVAVLFSYMCRLPAAELVFTSERQARAAACGHLSLETDADDTSYSALTSVRETVAMPTGVAATYVEDKLRANPLGTTEVTMDGVHPVSVKTVRGTLKGTIDAQGKPLGYMPWSWNVVMLPDGKRYLLDVALCAANVPVKFLLQHHASVTAVANGELSAGGEPAGGKAAPAKGEKGAPAGGAAPAGANASEAIAAALTATFGAYSPLAGHLQFHRAADLKKIAEELSRPQSEAATEAAEVTPANGTRAYHRAPLLVQSGTLVTPAIAATAVACAGAGVPHSSALGAWAEPLPPQTAPLNLQQLASFLSRTCFEGAYFFADPRHFATLHYPDDQELLLLAPPPVDPRADAGTRRHAHRLVTRAQWEAYPRLTHAATGMGFALESHARRSNFTAKGCPVYMSFCLGNAPQTELQVTVFRGTLQGVINHQQAMPCPVPAEGASAAQFAQTADMTMSAALQAIQANYSVICHSGNTQVPAGGAAAESSPTGGATGSPSGTQTLSVVDPTYYGLSREERARRSVVSLMLPDVGQYTVAIGARHLDESGRPASSMFTLMTAYQLTVSFVPTNEPLMPRVREPPTVAKLLAPATSRVASGQVYFSVAPTLPRVIAAVVINEVAPVIAKVPKGESSLVKQASGDVAGTTAPQTIQQEGFTRYYFLPWDAENASFNGTCRIDVGTVSLWIGLRPENLKNDELESMVPAHLLPSVGSASTASLLTALMMDGDFAPKPVTICEDDPRPPTSGTAPESAPSQPTVPAAMPLSQSAFELLQKLHASSKPPAGGPIPVPLTAQALATAWRPNTAPVAEEPVETKPAKGKAKGKAAAAAAPPPPPPPVAKPPPPAAFVPFVTSMAAVRRIPSKDATLLTNGFSQGAEKAPAELEEYVPPPSLLYVPPSSGVEHRVAHGILARTGDDETQRIVGNTRATVGTVFQKPGTATA